MGLRINTEHGGGQIAYGVTGQFKFNPSTLSVRKKRGSNVLHLTRAKPDMVTVSGLFQATHDGTRLDEGEFVYESASKYLRIENIEVCTGLVLDNEAALEFGIPILGIARPATVLTNIYYPEEYLTMLTGGV